MIAVLLLAATYLLGDRLLPRARKHPRRWLSVGAGASMAYVFLDALPELAGHQGKFLARTGEVAAAEHRIYALALVGFVFLYGLDEMVRRSGRGDGGPEGADTGGAVFAAHIAGYALYGVIIGDALVTRAVRGSLAFPLYVVAMILHLLVVTSALAREHGKRYHRRGRWVLAASIPAGWAVAVLAPLGEVAMARLFAFVAGGVLMTSANEELPRDKGGRFGWFVAGASVYGALLFLT